METTIYDKIMVTIFSLILIFTVLFLSIFISNPTPFEYYVFRVVTALTVGGIGGILAKVIAARTEFNKFFVFFGGALTLFPFIYIFSAPLSIPNQNSSINILILTIFILSILALFSAITQLLVKYISLFYENNSLTKISKIVEMKTNNIEIKLDANNLTEDDVTYLIENLIDRSINDKGKGALNNE